jgi:Ca-activated chloride channel family protein
MKRLITILFLSLIVFQAEGQSKKTRILFILDASASMNNSWDGSTKIKIANKVIGEVMDSLAQLEDVFFGIRVYGHESPASDRNCKDTKLEVGFGGGEHTAILIRNQLAGIHPKGTTPIAYSLMKGGQDFPVDGNSRNIIILVTDGAESCDGDPCAVSASLQKSRTFLQPFIIGMGIVDPSRDFGCMGKFQNASSTQDFSATFKKIIKQVISRTTTQVDLLDAADKPIETDLNMTFYDANSGVIRYQIYHTMNQYGFPDTLFIDPVNTYNITVHSIPPVKLDRLSLIPDRHNVIPIKTPQGDLSLKMQGIAPFNNRDRKLKVLVRRSGDYETIHVQDLNTDRKFIVGDYDIEILTLPRIIKTKVPITQSKVTTIQIPAPGLLQLSKGGPGYGAIYNMVDGKMELVYQLKEGKVRENIALQPGQYRVVYRSKSSNKMRHSVDKTFEITSGGSLNLSL